MYVAITRARKKLYLTMAQSRMLHGQTRYNVVSRFLSEIPPQLLAWINRPTTRSRPPLAQAAGQRPKPIVTGHGFRIGQSVLHPKFGVGVIIDCEGSGPDARVQVNFGGSDGIKWLALEYAKLSPA